MEEWVTEEYNSVWKQQRKSAALRAVAVCQGNQLTKTTVLSAVGTGVSGPPPTVMLLLSNVMSHPWDNEDTRDVMDASVADTARAHKA